MNTQAWRIGLGAVGLVVALAVGCGDDEENPSPSGTGTFTTSSGSTTTTGSGGGGEGGEGAGGGGEGGGCVGEDGCFSCAPDETAEFLEACTDAQCAAFDNDARLPLYDDGELPPLP